tara:strand:+ start:2355 stop:2795 length:441 start_codon:yes stop_codon:yes gene_type:complete
MAIHPRKTIREKVVSILSSGVSSASGRVYDSRTQVVQTAPFVVVNSVSDEPEEPFIGLSHPTYNRVITFEIQCVDTERPSSGTLAGNADDLSREVELALQANLTLDNLALSCLLGGAIVNASEEIDPPAYQVTLTYFVRYEDTVGL